MSEPFYAEVRLFGGTFAPRNWAFCFGQLLPISSNDALFSVVGTIYGGDGRTTFGLPDLRGRSPRGAGRGPGLPDVRLGARGGRETVAMSVANMPSHDHQSQVSSDDATTDVPGVQAKSGEAIYLSVDDAGNLEPTGGTTRATGRNQPISVLNPYLGLNYIIALNGIYPSRR